MWNAKEGSGIRLYRYPIIAFSSTSIVFGFWSLPFLLYTSTIFMTITRSIQCQSNYCSRFCKIYIWIPCFSCLMSAAAMCYRSWRLMNVGLVMFAVCRQAYSRNVRASGALKFGYEGVLRVLVMCLLNPCMYLGMMVTYRSEAVGMLLGAFGVIIIKHNNYQKVITCCYKFSDQSTLVSSDARVNWFRRLWKTFHMPYANNKRADQPAHPRSLISALVFNCRYI